MDTITQDIEALVSGNHAFPHHILGYHVDNGEAVIRTFQPYARTVNLCYSETDKREMKKIHPDGLFVLTLPNTDFIPYTFEVTDCEDHTWSIEDPYRFPLIITDFDLYLLGEGTHYRTYEKIGAHTMSLEGVEGVHFAVWAPNAARVSILGWFNRWDGRHHPLENRGSSGLWEIFIPHLKEGDLYKFEIKGQNGNLEMKADPYAFASELRPQTASMVWNIHKYEWHDEAWMNQRPKTDWHNQPISIYEVHLGSWQRIVEENDRFLTYHEFAERLIPYVKELGYTHIELLPISEHPFDASWGYQTIGYYAPTSRFGTPDDLKYFIDRCHQENIGVIVDWVPAHFPKDEHGLALFDGTHLYEHADPRKGEHMDWGTLIFNYGRHEVLSFLLSNAMFLAEVYHVDGLRVDAVASMLYLDYSRKEGEWLPNQHGGRENLEAVEFLRKFNEITHGDYPGFLTFAEESTAWPMVTRPTHLGGLGFDFKWNMGWMNDTLFYFSKNPAHRKYHHNQITFSLMYAFTENFILPISHDEVVHGKGSILNKMPGDPWQKFATTRLFYTYMWTHPGKKLLFMGCEFGQWVEWTDQHSLSWHLSEHERHQSLRQLITDLNALYTSQPSLYEQDFSWDGFQWLDLHDTEQSIMSYIRRAKNPENFVVCVFNFTPVPRSNYRIGVPQMGSYKEILNTDASCYWGSNMGNQGSVQADNSPWGDQPNLITITLPPLAALVFKLE